MNTGFGLQSIPERRMTTQLSSAAAAPTEPDLKTFVKRVDRKFTISHNNRVEPNFNSMTYQEEARASFKKRMGYNPMEAAKKRHNPKLLNVTSEYSQVNNKKGATPSKDILSQIETRINVSLANERQRNINHLSRSADHSFHSIS